MRWGAIAIGFVAVVAIALVIVRRKFRVMRAAAFANLVAALEPEGIEMQSPFVGGSVRYRDYRAPGRYHMASIRALRAALVLTRSHLVIFTAREQRIPRAELAQWSPTVQDGKLVLATDSPPGATGHMALHLRVADPEAWVTALATRPTLVHPPRIYLEDSDG